MEKLVNLDDGRIHHLEEWNGYKYSLDGDWSNLFKIHPDFKRLQATCNYMPYETMAHQWRVRWH